MPGDSRLAEQAVELVESGSSGAEAALAEIAGAPTEVRTESLRRLRSLAADDPAAFEGLVPAVASFLTDDERPVRLSTAKALVAVARDAPEAVVPAVDPLAGRLADEEEFYYVRARAAEALGYVALEYPDAVASPEILADLRIGLAFDEPEVREKLAGAIERVALGDPDRLRHLLGRLAERLDDDAELVRYHLCTALVAVGTAHPTKLADASDALLARLDDPNPYVRGRAAEALGLLGEADADVSVPTDRLSALLDTDEAFVVERARFARRALGADPGGDGPATADPVGTAEAVRTSTERAVDAMSTPSEDGACPSCGLELPAGGPPMCPRCGAPR